ncbi:uncharacterized protein H6S33_000578 [Morchella sextelata]|uniref:uncharacterized protein n=1 Tax=Morchella sextelata TaxID=1174677 RepID=UPI001D04DC3B|nr:uncharacterized protein H6S33_000578 [Morchella sextelata]KAH0614942.1 hypothetical protein H6S33_000578 [Morchella sextelata]
MTTPTKSLEASTLSLLTLISHSRSLLSSGGIAPASKPSTDNPLDILHDIGALTRAHTTKLSIAIRPPNIIYDAAARCVQDIMQFVVPPLLATVELMSPKQHGSTLYAAVLRAADNTLAALEEFAKEIPEICRVGKSAGARDRLASTGVVWQAADGLVALRAKGLAGVVQDVVESHMAMLKDAMAELKEWLESNDEDEDDEAEGEAEDEDAFWDAPKKALSKDDTEAREKVDASLKKMKLATILLGAVVKRRLAGEGKLQDAQRLDKIAELAKSVANSGDDIGMGYYEDDADEAAEAQKEFEKKAIELAELATLANDGNDDSFSKWFRNCKDAISKNG